eukprot:g11156.t1
MWADASKFIDWPKLKATNTSYRLVCCHDGFLLWQLLCLCSSYQLPEPLWRYARSALLRVLVDSTFAVVTPLLLEARDEVGLSDLEACFAAHTFLQSPEVALRSCEQPQAYVDPEVASTDSPDSSGSSFSAFTGQTAAAAGTTSKEASRCSSCLSILNCCKREPVASVARKDEAKDAKQTTKIKDSKESRAHIDVPKTFEEMFHWNSAVMGLSSRKWMNEILNCFTAMVEHISDMKRLQQECDIVAIRMARTSGDNMNLSEFKSCMLAALRSLLPTTWDTNHELAWNWPLSRDRKFMKEIFPPFIEAAVESMHRHVSDNVALEAFSWSLNVIAQMLVHTVTEGCTIVMKAINNNSTSQLQSAVNAAPRGERFNWVLIVKVGTQDISPLRWAIESGSLHAAKAIIEDLLTIRADRERYYYGVDHLFTRHPDIMQIICSEAPSLLETFLEGLVWRSRLAKDGLRRVNYYVKNLFVDLQGHFAGALQALVGLGDPRMISHPVVDLVSNRLWTGLVMKQFLVAKLWFIFSLVILMVSQTLLPEYQESFEVRVVTLICRAITYLLTLMVLIIQHSRDVVKGYLHRDTARVFRIPVPRYLTQFYHLASFMLMVCLILMLMYEPFIHCSYSQVIGRFMFALMFLLTTFASAITVLEHHYEDMKQFSDTMICLSGITLPVFGFITASAILLLNLLIAQLNCSYVYIYQNMLGYAKLKRASVNVQTLVYTKPERWENFVNSLGFKTPLEFNEGDVGMAGGIQAMEPQNLAVVASDRILRFGGSCSQDLEWPADNSRSQVDEEEDSAVKLRRDLFLWRSVA